MREVISADKSRYSVPSRDPDAPKSAALGGNPSQLSVLVVDDEPLIRWSLKTGLTRRGHEVVEADTGADAVKSLGTDEDRFDVVVLDYRLPDRQDLSLLADVRRLLPKAMVLMMTAFGDAEMRSGALALGAHAVVDKPFQVDRLIALIESLAIH